MTYPLQINAQIVESMFFVGEVVIHIRSYNSSSQTPDEGKFCLSLNNNLTLSKFTKVNISNAIIHGASPKKGINVEASLSTLSFYLSDSALVDHALIILPYLSFIKLEDIYITNTEGIRGVPLLTPKPPLQDKLT